MGSPLSPIAADIVMNDLETKCISSLLSQPPFYFRYVDDIITAILKMTHIAGNPHAVNQRADTENLSVFYLLLLNEKLYYHQKMHIFKAHTLKYTHTHEFPEKILNMSKTNYFNSYYTLWPPFVVVPQSS